MKMQLLRRNNVNPIPGAPHQTSAFYGGRGWKPRKSSPPPVEGELFSLTFPFIDQAFTQLCAFCSLDRRKESANLCYRDVSPITVSAPEESVLHEATHH